MPLRTHGTLEGRRWHSLTVALLAAGAGIAVYVFDNVLKDPVAEGSLLKHLLQTAELLVMGPGLGVLTWMLFENLRLRDAQAQRLLEAERAQRFVLLGRIAASVAHEIRNPLHNLRLIGEAIGRDANPHDRALFARLEGNLARLDQSVALVYELARPNQHLDGPERESVDLVSVLDEAEQGLHHPTARIERSIPRRIRVAGSAGSLRIAIANLLRNACEASGDGAIRLMVEEHGSDAHVIIENRGSFPPEVLRGEPSIESLKAHGMGVGVGLARHLLERIGGVLMLENRGEAAVVTVKVALWRGDEAHDPNPRPGG